MLVHNSFITVIWEIIFFWLKKILVSRTYINKSLLLLKSVKWTQLPQNFKTLP